MVDAALEQQVRRLAIAAFGGQPVGILEQRDRGIAIRGPFGLFLRALRTSGIVGAVGASAQASRARRPAAETAPRRRARRTSESAGCDMVRVLCVMGRRDWLARF